MSRDSRDRGCKDEAGCLSDKGDFSLRKKTAILFLLLFIISAPRFLDASDIRPFELSARAAALGGSFVTRTDDSSSVFYNPAALAFSLGFMVKLNLFYPKITMTAESLAIPMSSKNDLGKLRGSTFISCNIKERIGLGIGVFFPHSMETRWLDSWAGNTLSIRSKWNTLYIRPVVAVKVSKHLSVGAGLDIISSNVNWKYNRIFTFQEIGSGENLQASSESDVSAKGIGYVAGVLIRISDNLRLGGRYQTKVTLDFDGAHSFIIQRGSESPFGILQETNTTLTLPLEFVIGGMYSLGKNLTLQLDFQRIGMSEIKQWEFDLDPEFYEMIEDYYGTKPDNIRQGVDLNMRNTSRIMFGVEYRFKNSIAIRAGYTHQKSAFDSQMIHPVFPDLDTNIVSFGIGYDGPTFSVWDTYEKLGGISLDAFFQYGFSPKKTSTLPELPATYQASRWIVGLGLGITFGSL